MVRIVGMLLADIPSVGRMEEAIGESWMACWRAAHPNLKEGEAARKSLAGLFLLRLLDVDGELRYSSLGRPHLINASADFSISHTNTAVFCALSLGDEGRIGLDAEDGERLPLSRLSALAKRWFGEREREVFYSSPTKESFLSLWTAKEALVKREGSGLAALAATDTLLAAERGEAVFACYWSNGTCITLCADPNTPMPRDLKLLGAENLEQKI